MASRSQRSARPGRRWGVLGSVAAVVLGVLLWIGLRTATPPPDAASTVVTRQQLERAQSHLAARRWDEAGNAAGEILRAEPSHAAALLIAGEAAFRRELYPEALAYYGRVPESAPEHLPATLAAAEIQRTQGSFDQAEWLYRRALQAEPQHVTALDRLATLLKLTGRHNEARELLLKLLSLGAVQVHQLRWLADPGHPVRGETALQQTLRAVPDQIFPRLGLAELKLAAGDLSGAREILTALRTARPQQPDIEALYGRCLWEARDRTELGIWETQLSDPARDRAEIWHLLGLLREEQNRLPEACRCHLECLFRDPDHAAAAHRAGRLLIALNHTAEGTALLRRAEQLTEVLALSEQIRPEQPDVDVCRQLAAQLEGLGRVWEAYAWTAVVAREPTADSAWVTSTVQRLEPQLAAGTPLDRAPVLPDLAALMVRFSLTTSSPSGPPATLTRGETPSLVEGLSFVDEAAQAGIEFVYFEDPDPASEGRRMHEFTGGGVAVLDYDLDGWPDLYFTQGSELTSQNPATNRLDQLWRNRGDGRFDLVTPASRVHEEGFSQGVSAGDFNNDGFPDLYIANLGRNRLFENRGDGTFGEVSIPDQAAWTTSCAIADVNLDGVPDLYDVNYVQGPDLLDRRCPTPAGPRVCSPDAFDAAPDRLLLGLGDGEFRDASATAGINPPGGKGLGVLIGPLSGGGPAVDVFVANDMEANFLLLDEAAPGASPVFRDQALAKGLAYGHDGRAQACMGIAAADFDHNGRLDLFVTNYFNEPNAFYLQDESGLFDDQCHRAGLRQASLPMLGFGTQAVDVNLDGHSDLVVANGDLDDFSHVPRPFRMRPQVFLNKGVAQFTEWLSAPRGDYFSTDSTHRGRGLAWLDWNRDGRPDFAVSQLDEPSALVTNRTRTSGGFVAVRLVGTVCSRDAIGTEVRLFPESHPERGVVAWMTAGDGYQSSNQRELLFGVGEEPGPFAVEIHWPGGMIATYRGLARDETGVCIEGRDSVQRWEFAGR
uniref:Tetratricopeptide repeat protein n=1 Tax=Schlesneria paludicola TaxID=360056 RepID=A0A7C2K0J6_9PLAN